MKQNRILAIVGAWAVIAVGCGSVRAQTLLINGNFMANAAAFTFWPGYAGSGVNPAIITGWTKNGQWGVNGNGTVTSVFGPTNDGGRTYAFDQNGGSLIQTLSGSYTPGMTYQLSFEVGGRAGDPSASFRVQIGDSVNIHVSTQVGGVDVLTANTAQFNPYSYTYTAPASFVGVPSIQLYNFTGNATVDFANVKLVQLPETIFPTAGQGVPMDQAAPLTLSWVQVTNAVAYDGYFGTTSNSVFTATTNTAGIYIGRTSALTFNAGALQPNTTYYWRVDGVTAAGGRIKGAVVAFTTGKAMTDVMMDTWVATDALNRTLPGHAEAGPLRGDRPIGIFYFLWHGTNSLGNDGPRDNTKEILRLGGYTDAHNPWASNPLWMTGGNGRAWYWGEPECGYYGNDDEWVIRRHIAMLEAAGVDVLGFDNTNALNYEQNYLKVLAVIRKMQMEGTPVHLKIFFYTHSASPATVTWLYNHFYKPGLYPDLWFQWQGKPLIIGYPNGLAGDGSTPVSGEVLNFFNWRTGWAYVSGTLENEWQWIDVPTPQNWGWNGRSDIPEQLSVASGGWAAGNLGRSNTNGVQPAYDNFHLSAGRNEGQGLFYNEQNFYGLKVDPQFLWITGWNEWWAGAWDAPTDCYTTLLADCTPINKRYFVDCYNAAYSRDIEPMKGGYTDNYYYQMVANNRLRKGARPVPMATASKTINLAGDFSDWLDVGPDFRDVAGDTLARNWPTTFGNLPNYSDATGRNDFTLLKVARDANNIYFLAQCVSNLTSYTGSNWMNLFINTDRSRATGWEGYDFAVNLGGRTATTTTLSQNLGTNWNWTTIRSDIAYKVTGNQLMLAIPRASLGLTNDPVTFDFHWADNFQTNDISGFFQYGDSAPDRRFNYRYQAAVGTTVTLRQDNFDGGKQTWWDESWTNGSRWSITATDSYTGSSAACSTANGTSQNMLITRVDTSSLESLRVSFRFKLSNVLDAQNLNVQFNTASGWVTVRDLGRDQLYPTGQAWGYNERQNVWQLCTDARAKSGTNATFFHKNFAVRIDGSGVSSGKTAWIDDFQITGVVAATNNPPPAPWQNADIGTTGISGEASYANGGFTVSGSGADIGSTADGFQFVYQSRSGDGYLTARVVGQTPTDVWAKAGVMIRESTAAGARNTAMLLSGSNGLAFQRRVATDSNTDLTGLGPNGVSPYWVRLVRSGSSFSGYASADGASWTLVGTTNIPGFSATTLWGMAVSAHTNAKFNAATFDNVALNQWPVIANINNRTNIAGQTLTLANTATDPDVPPQTLTWSLLTAPTNAFLNSTSGLFTWRPTLAQSPASNYISLSVTDNGTPNLAATQSYSVFVLRPITPMISAPTMTNGVFGMSVSGDIGPDYTFLTSTNLVQWTPLLTTNPPAMPFWMTDPTTNTYRFYRVLLGP